MGYIHGLKSWPQMKITEFVGYKIVKMVSHPPDERGCTGFVIMTRKSGTVVCLAAKYRNDQYTKPIILGIKRSTQCSQELKIFSEKDSKQP